jgi:hypothetical protein
MKKQDDEITNREAATVGALVAVLSQGKNIEHNAAVMAERLAVRVNGRASTFEEVWALGNAEFKSIQRSSVEEIAQHFFLLGCATADAAAHLPKADDGEEMKNITPTDERSKRAKSKGKK